MKFSILIFLISFSLLAEEGVERWKVEAQINYFENLIGRKIENVLLQTPDAKKASLYSKDSKGTLVCIFDIDCPMSLKLAPKLKRLESQFKDLTFKHLLISKEAKSGEVLEVYKKRGFQGELIVDSKEGKAASALKVKTTCEVFLIDASGTLIFRGAVDDQYGIGFSREEAKNHYLQNAVESHLKGKLPDLRLTSAPGCLVEIKEQKTADSKITFHKDISRLLQSHCQRCHHDGGVGPFSLISFSEVKERRKMIKYVVSKKIMPPWFAEGGGPWRDNYNLADAERKLLLDWIEAGAPEGDKADAPLPRTFPKKWQLENPDLVVPLNRTIAVKAEGVMKYLNLNVKVPTQEDKWISAVEIRTENPQVLHHALVFHLGADETKFRQADTSGVRGFFAGYVPGNQMSVYPQGSGKKLAAGTYLRFQLHYTPNGTAVNDRISIAFKFLDKKPPSLIETKSAFNNRFIIPPRDANYKVEARHKFIQNGYLVGFSPHAHLRGKAFKYDLVMPDGKRETLVDIPRYDFNWQITYQYQTPREVKAGSYLEVTAHYDNSEKNPANPDPNARVRFGDQTDDEMMIGYFEFIESANDSIEMPENLKKYVDALLQQMNSKKIDQQQAGRLLLQFLLGEVRNGKMSRQEATNYFQAIAKKYGDKQ